MIKMSECVEALKRNTPSYFQFNDWMSDRCQMTVCSLYLDGMSASIDISEIKDKTDAEVRELINSRIIGALHDAILQIDPNYSGGQ